MSEQPSIEPLREIVRDLGKGHLGAPDVYAQAIAAYDNLKRELDHANDIISDDLGDAIADRLKQAEAQVAALTKEKDQVTADRDAKVLDYEIELQRMVELCNRREKLEEKLLSKLSTATKERDSLRSDCAQMGDSINEGHAITLDRLHALEQGVKVAVEALIQCRQYQGCDIVPPLRDSAIAHLTPLLTTPTKGGEHFNGMENPSKYNPDWQR